MVEGKAKKPKAKTTKPSSKDKEKIKKSIKPVRAVTPVDQPIKAAVVLLFTKCRGGVALLLGKENYEKWGPPSGYVNPNEDPDVAAVREFQEEVGQPLPKPKSEVSFRYRNAHVKLIYTEDCVEPKIGKLAKEPRELMELAHIPVNLVYDLLAKPKPEMPLRAVFISMMMDNKKVIGEFMKKI